MSKQLSDERTPLLSATTAPDDGHHHDPLLTNNLHGTYQATTETDTSTSKSAFVSGVGSMPMGGSMMTLPGGTSTSINGDNIGSAVISQESAGAGKGGRRRQQVDTAASPLAVNGDYQRINNGGGYGNGAAAEVLCTEEQTKNPTDKTEIVVPAGNGGISPTHNYRGIHLPPSVQRYIDPLQKYWTLILALIIVVAVPLVMVGSIVAPVMITDPCKILNSSELILPNDTILINASYSELCHTAPTMYLPTNYETPKQPIHVSPVDCNDLKFSKSRFSDGPYSRDNRSIPLTVFDIRYMIEGGVVTVNLNVTVSSKNGSEVYMCLFDNITLFLGEFDSNPNWMKAVPNAVRACSRYNVTNQSVLLSEMFIVNKTSYYVIGVAATQKLDFVQYSYEGSTLILSYTVYNSSEIDCSGDKCMPTKSCVIAHADAYEDPNEFTKYFVHSVYETIVFTMRGIVSVGVSAGFLAFIICAIVIVCVVQRNSKRKN